MGLVYQASDLLKLQKLKDLILEPGDILITNSTSSSGLNGPGITGHAGIVNPDGKTFTSIRGTGYTAESKSIKWWFSNYPKTKVVRYKMLLKQKRPRLTHIKIMGVKKENIQRKATE